MAVADEWSLISLIPNHKPGTIAEQLLVSWVGNFGVPRSINSELGDVFKREVWQALCDRAKVGKPHNPHTMYELSQNNQIS